MKRKRLELNRETISTLDAPRLRRAAAGDTNDVTDCFGASCGCPSHHPNCSCDVTTCPSCPI